MNQVLIVVVRGIIAFFSLLIFTRILGKQQISQLTFFDYIVGITIGGLATRITTDIHTNILANWTALALWTFLSFMLQMVTLKSHKICNYINGKPVIVIMNGKILESSLRSTRFTLSDLLEQLRDKGIFDLREIAFAVMERSGKLSVLKKPEFLPANRKDLNMPPMPSSIDTDLIYDGIVLYENLNSINKNINWLYKELKKQGVNKPSEVFIASFNPDKSLYLDLYKDHIKK